ncbi:hypothetical protein [Comamonas thiooxydans]|uniref:hypothetical protein n=1 Tax=Comamonas thiooxydans TaxID=363952 RepID=UPI003D095929
MFGLSKPIPKDKGAKLAQAQNQAPDSIPGMFKPGEFVLPPDTVHAMGGKQALQGVVDATHTPVAAYGLNAPRASSSQSKAAPQLGLKPEVFFANGGAPEDQLPGLGLKPSAAPSPINTFPGNRLPGNSGSSSAPPTPAAAPVAAPTQPAEQGGFSYQDNNRAVGADIKRTWNEGNYGEAIGKSVAGTIGAVTTPVIDGAVNAGSAVAGFGRGLFGIGADAPAPAAAPAAASPSAGTAVARGGAAPASPVVAGGAAGAGAREVNPQTATPAPSKQVIDGVYNHGRGQYSDQATGMGFPAGFTGKPNARNLAAADNLAASNAAPAAAGGTTEEGGFGLRAPAVAHSGNDWAARQRLKNLETSASSIMNTQRWGGKGAANNPAPQNFLDASRADLAAQGKVPDFQMRTNEVNAGLRRAAMAEAGADRRAQGQIGLGLGQLALGAQRNQLDAQRITNDERLRAPQIRAAERIGQLQDQYLSAKTPEEQAAIAAQIRAYSGKDSDSWKAVALQGGTDAQGNKTESILGAVNERTGEMRRMDSSRKPPAVDSPEVQAIRNNTALTMEQRREELRKLGFN